MPAAKFITPSAADEQSIAKSGLTAAMEALARPALIAARVGLVFHANRQARALLDSGGLTVELLRARIADGEALPLEGAEDAYLVILESDGDAIAARCATRWKATPREREVLHGVVHGWSNKEIASELAASESTVERHVTALLHKSRCGSRLKLIAACWRGDS